MTSDDTGKKARGPRRAKRRLLSAESLIWLGLFGVAGAAAFLPWYAVTGNHGLGIRNDGRLRLSGHRDDINRTSLYSSLRTFARNNDPQAGRSGDDPLETGAIPAISRQMQEARDKADSKQPFPGRPFRLVHIANGQALITDGQGMYLVGIGSKLPDGSRLERFDRRENGWVIVTSEGTAVGD